MPAGGLLLGRKTYEIFASHWPRVGDERPMAASSTPRRSTSPRGRSSTLEWTNSTLLEGDVAEAVEALKAEDGGYLFVIGSSELVQTLLRHDLVDTFVVWTFPVVLGEGKRLFGDGAIPIGLRLADVQTSTTGVTVATYERAGEIRFGSFGLETDRRPRASRRTRSSPARSRGGGPITWGGGARASAGRCRSGAAPRPGLCRARSRGSARAPRARPGRPTSRQCRPTDIIFGAPSRPRHRACRSCPSDRRRTGRRS